MILEKEALELEMAQKETKLASLQSKTRCKSKQEEKLKKPLSITKEAHTYALTRTTQHATHVVGVDILPFLVES